MLISMKFFEKLFKGENYKEAYTKSTKWIANNVLKVEIKDVTFKISKITDKDDLPTIKLELFAGLDSNELKNHRCTVCKEFHKSFYINQEYNCNACKMKGYLDEAEQKLNIKKNYTKGILRDIILK